MEALLIPALSGVLAAIVGRMKGSSFLIWLLVGTALPLIGLIAAALYRNERDEPERPCPRCGTWQKIHVQVCGKCGLDMDLPDPTEVRPGR